MKKAELLLPAGNTTCLRAAVANGADAVYLGMDHFNARRFAGNFVEENIFSVVDFCHKSGVKVYVTFNVLVKNDEIESYLKLMDTVYQAKADAVIIQDPCFIPYIKKNFPGLGIHLSTQATATNTFSVPDGIDRVVPARELSFNEIKAFTSKFETEVFVHGALCFSYSGQCLFSSMVGGRSGNRGQCAQPCRRKYNNNYLLSTMDLCLLERIPELIEAGIASFKIEGRMRSPLYVATAAKIYRKYIDLFYQGSFRKGDKADVKDYAELKLAFSREFTEGFGFTDKITDPRMPMNRGLYIGRLREGRIELKEDLKLGDGIGIWLGAEMKGYSLNRMLIDGKQVKKAVKNDVVEIDFLGAPDGSPVYKTSSADMALELGDEIRPLTHKYKRTELIIPSFQKKENPDQAKIFAKTYNIKSLVLADKAKPDVVYYDLFKEDCLQAKSLVKNSKFFVYTPRIMSDDGVKEALRKISEIRPDGILIGNRGLLSFREDLKEYIIHLDYSFNVFNDLDLATYPGIPIISPELSFEEVSLLNNKNFIVIVHGDVILMNTKNTLNTEEIVDEQGRHFKIRKSNGITEILNTDQLGLFSKAKDYLRQGIKYFMIDVKDEPDKFIRIYRKILSGESFDDKKIRKGYTTGHFAKGVA